MPITKTDAWWLTAAADGQFGTVLEMPAGVARVIATPNVHGVTRIRYAGTGTVAPFNPRLEPFEIIPAPTGPLLYLRHEYAAWSKDRDQLDRDRADRKSYDDSDDAALQLLQGFATATGLLQPSDSRPSGPVCAPCLATGWNFTDDPAHPVWCTVCRGTGRNPAPELLADPECVEDHRDYQGAGVCREPSCSRYGR